MNNQGKILLVDDDKAFRTITSGLLEDEGYEVITANNAKQGLQQVVEQSFDLILSDLMMEGENGLQFMKNIRQYDSKVLIIMITGFASIDSAVEAMKLGAFDYLTKPCSNAELLLKISKAMDSRKSQDELERLRSEVYARHSYHNIIGKSKRMMHVFDLIEQVADSDTSVLISGETGTGKELVARAIHYNSSRRDQPFVAVNCAALPDTLLESELFGHEKGAFSGAIKQKPGRFEIANQGTLFLDEIGDIPVSTQVKLLRVLQEKQFERLGSTQTISTNIRLISATHRNLEQDIATGTFRQDLYFRLNVMPIQLPPLRDRLEDIPLLIDSFIQKNNKEKKRDILRVSESVLQLMMAYEWPGNIRELENVIERAVLLCKNSVIEVEHLMFQKQQNDIELVQQAVRDHLSEQKLNELYARMVLDEKDGNKKAACEILGIDFKTLQKRLG